MKNYLYLFFGAAAIAGVVAYIMEQPYALYCYAIGAIGMTAVRITTLSHSADVRARRQNRIQAFSALLLLGSIYLMYIEHKAWIIPIFISAVLDLTFSFRPIKK
ncbi:MAG: hypothetical protein LBR81_02325 [Prevotellaceae bacterium]|jgi:hypothetical protein|nr:hypothetical protein [Prevotellaceae bacterium]